MMARDIEDIKHGNARDAVSTMHTKDLACRIAKALLLHYVHGEFEYSARLREVYAEGGQSCITQRIANEMYIVRAATSRSSSHSSSSSEEALNDEIINFRPANQKPSFKFEPSGIGASLPSFLASLKASNEELATGVPADCKFELSDSDSEGQHIEMNLGLGVLEQTTPAGTTTTPLLTHKRKSGSISDSPDSITSSTKKLKLVTSRKTTDAIARSSTSSSGSTSPPIKTKLRSLRKVDDEDTGSSSSDVSSSPIDVMPTRPIKVILYHNSYAHAHIQPPRRPAKPATIERETSKKQGKEADEEGAPKKPKIILKLAIKNGAIVRTIRVSDDLWTSAYSPQSGTKQSPASDHHTDTEMGAWNESLLAALGEGSLPGFDLVHDDDDDDDDE